MNGARTDDVALLTVSFAASLRERARVIAKRKRTSTAQLIRDGLEEKVSYFEAQIRAEERQCAAEKADRRAARGLRKLRGLNGQKPTPANGAVLPSVEEDPLSALYEHHAQRVLDATEGTTEHRLRLAEALAAIKRRAPLTCPSDAEILRILQKAAERLLDARKKKMHASTDPVPEASEKEHVIDPSVPVHGDDEA